MKHQRIDHGLPVGPGASEIWRGSIANSAGRMAEESVARHYASLGYRVVAERWRGQAGEIDLIVQSGGEYVFVEVKKARRHDLAALRLGHAQMRRICAAAQEYCGCLPQGLATPMRLDAALVDDLGRVEVIENAFGGF